MCGNGYESEHTAGQNRSICSFQMYKLDFKTLCSLLCILGTAAVRYDVFIFSRLQAALIMQVLQLTPDQIAMLPAEQRQSILILKEQIQKTAGAP